MITTYNQAKRLKELGYDRPSRYYYQPEYGIDIFNDLGVSDYNTLPRWEDKRCSAPSVSEALQWIREKYKIVCAVEVDYYDGFYYTGKWADEPIYAFQYTNSFNTYPEASSALLDELLTYLEQKR